MRSEKKWSNKQTIRVRFNEVDALNIVWHGHYIVYFEDGREAFGRQYGISYLDIKRAGFTTPIVKSTCEHFLPLKYGEEFVIETIFTPTAAAKLIFEYVLWNQEGKLVCKGSTVQVFLDETQSLCLYHPLFFQEWKDKMYTR